MLNKDVLSAEKWNEEAIVKRAKVLANVLIDQFAYVDKHADVSETNELSLRVDSGISVSNTKPEEFSFVGEYVKVSSWADLFYKFINLAYELQTETFRDLAAEDYSISNASSTYISNDKRKLRKAKQIDNSGIFYEANLSSDNIISFIKDLLLKMKLDVDEFTFSLSDAPFDVNDENTWSEGLLPVGKLFYHFMEDLISKEKITASELERLKTKVYTKSLFRATDYPAVANSRTDNMGNSACKRYRAKALRFQGADVYVSTQFFEADRDAVIEWYKGHLS